MPSSHPVRSAQQLGAELRRRRLALGLTQAELGARVNARQATVSTLESGTSDIRLSTLMDVLAALDLQLTLQPRAAGTPKMDELF